jgi:Tfp pilus assembly protein PilW
MTSNLINHKPTLQGSAAMQHEGKFAQTLLHQKSKEAGYSFLENGGDPAGLNVRASNNLPDCMNSGTDQTHLQKRRLVSISPVPKMIDVKHQH